MSTNTNIEITVKNKTGIHARPAAMIVQTASKFKSEIKVYKDNMEINAKSIMGVLMLAASQGTTIQLSASGEDSEAAAEALKNLIESGFGEL